MHAAECLFIIDLMFIRLPVKRRVLGPELILTSPEKINSRDTSHGLTCLQECVTDEYVLVLPGRPC